jgi:hypothetical protein
VALFVPGVICNAPVARAYVYGRTTQTALEVQISQSINKAINLGISQAVIGGVSTQDPLDIQNVIRLVTNLGYDVSLAGDLLTLNW